MESVHFWSQKNLVIDQVNSSYERMGHSEQSGDAAWYPEAPAEEQRECKDRLSFQVAPWKAEVRGTVPLSLICIPLNPL